MVLHTPLESRSPHVVACCDRAVRRHIRSGLPVAEARSLVPRGWFAVSDPAADREHLRRLAWDCQQFTPLAGLEPAEIPESLFLDVTGCAGHFGGMDALCRQVAECFQQKGYRVRIGAAPTFGAAWALAHQPQHRERPSKSASASLVAIAEPGELPAALSRLPITGLRLPREMLSLLSECGLVRIGQLFDLPRSSLPSRFGPVLLLRIDQTLGTAGELLEPDIPPIPLQAEKRFEFPLQDAESVLFVVRQLLENVLAQLHERRRQTQQLNLEWNTEEGNRSGCELRLLRPTTSADRLWELLSLRLETLQFTSGILSLQLEALTCPPLPPRKMTLFDEDEPGETEFLGLIERLGSRLGEQAVVRFRSLPEAQPELSVIGEPWLGKQNGESRAAEELMLRPFKFLSPPDLLRSVICSEQGGLSRFRWRQREHTVSLLEGPERIVTGWWREKMIRRNYYRVETTTGARFWLFHEPESSRWYLQGLFE